MFSLKKTATTFCDHKEMGLCRVTYLVDLKLVAKG